MNIFPAIDLREGQVVRLTEGDYDQMTVYSRDPAAIARSFADQGAAFLHVVDLDAAKDGTQKNLPALQSILCAANLFVQVGGGGRDEESIRRYLDLGVNRVIVGTMAVENPVLFASLAQKYPGKLCAGVDAKDGFVAIHGWKQITAIRAEDFLACLPDMGVDTAVYTDISKDGLLGGANLAAYQSAAAIPGLHLIASGGVSTEKDIRALSALHLYGAIIGKALYAGKLSLSRALELAREDAPC